jgi:hypothetical protein
VQLQKWLPAWGPDRAIRLMVDAPQTGQAGAESSLAGLARSIREGTSMGRAPWSSWNVPSVIVRS